MKANKRSVYGYVSIVKLKSDEVMRRLSQFEDLVVMTERLHLFPYRTQKLSSPVLMVLGPQGPGRVSRRQVNRKTVRDDCLFFYAQIVW